MTACETVLVAGRDAVVEVSGDNCVATGQEGRPDTAGGGSEVSLHAGGGGGGAAAAELPGVKSKSAANWRPTDLDKKAQRRTGLKDHGDA